MSKPGKPIIIIILPLCYSEFYSYFRLLIRTSIPESFNNFMISLVSVSPKWYG
jgi:hypothetical protein